MSLLKFPGRLVLTALWFISGTGGPCLGRDWTADLEELPW